MIQSNSPRVGSFCFAAICFCILVSGQSHALQEPRLRISDYFGAPGGIHFLDPDNLGQHSYQKCREEKKGMVYTQKGGFFDVGHAREAADRTRYAASVLHHHLMKSSKQFDYSMIEPSRYYVAVRYPENWMHLDREQRQVIAREVSIRFGQYLAHQSLIWHEIITWFGYSSSGLFSEQISSFSWEDPYSDVVGTYLAMEALRNEGVDYDAEITRLLSDRLQTLDVVPQTVAKKAARKVKGKWYTGDYYFFVKMKKRNFDVGFKDGQVTPWLVPGMFPDAAPQPCPAPFPTWLSEYDFQFNVQLDPKVGEKAQIYKAVNLDPANGRLQINTVFPILIDYIRKEARAKSGPDVDKPTL